MQLGGYSQWGGPAGTDAMGLSVFAPGDARAPVRASSGAFVPALQAGGGNFRVDVLGVVLVAGALLALEMWRPK
jgi:hypothetical protein